MRIGGLSMRPTQWILGVLLLLLPDLGGAACNPETCDAFFACGERACIGNTCLSIPDEAGTPCRAAAGLCDAAETCNGSSLSCPTDRKRSASAVCRSASSPCDAPEHCDGSSDLCPADTGSAPDVSVVTFLAGNLQEGGEILGHDLAIEVIGSNLCNARILMPDQSERSLEPAGGGPLPSRRLSLVTTYATPEERAADYPDGSYPIEINSGAASGSLVFAAGAPAAAVDVVAPETGALVGPAPSFTLVNHCADCTLMRLAIESLGPERRFVGQGFFDGWPVDEPFVRDLGQILPFRELLDGDYALHAETLDGVFAIGSFPPTVPEFEYVSGTVFRDELVFTVPEPSGAALQAIAAGVLAIRAAHRRRAQASPARSDRRC